MCRLGPAATGAAASGKHAPTTAPNTLRSAVGSSENPTTRLSRLSAMDRSTRPAQSVIRCARAEASTSLVSAPKTVQPPSATRSTGLSQAACSAMAAESLRHIEMSMSGMTNSKKPNTGTIRTYRPDCPNDPKASDTARLLAPMRVPELSIILSVPWLSVGTRIGAAASLITQ